MTDLLGSSAVHDGLAMTFSLTSLRSCARWRGQKWPMRTPGVPGQGGSWTPREWPSVHCANDLH